MGTRLWLSVSLLQGFRIFKVKLKPILLQIELPAPSHTLMVGKDVLDVLDDVKMDTSGHIQSLQTNATDTNVEE